MSDKGEVNLMSEEIKENINPTINQDQSLAQQQTKNQHPPKHPKIIELEQKNKIYEEELTKLNAIKRKLNDQLNEFEKKFKEIQSNKNEKKGKKGETSNTEEEVKMEQELKQSHKNVVKLQKEAEKLRSKNIISSQHQEKLYQYEIKLISKEKEIQQLSKENLDLENMLKIHKKELEQAKLFGNHNEKIQQYEKEISQAKNQLKELHSKEKSNLELNQKTTECYLIVNKLYRDLCEKYGLDSRLKPSEMNVNVAKSQSLPRIKKPLTKANKLRSSVNMNRMGQSSLPSDPFDDLDYSEENYKKVYAEYQRLITAFKDQNAAIQEAIVNPEKEIKELEKEIDSLNKLVSEKEKLVNISTNRLNELQRLQKLSKKFVKKKPPISQEADRTPFPDEKSKELIPNPDANFVNKNEQDLINKNEQDLINKNEQDSIKEDPKYFIVGDLSSQTTKDENDQAFDKEGARLVKIIAQFDNQKEEIINIQNHYQFSSGEIKVGKLMGKPLDQKLSTQEINIFSDQTIVSGFYALKNEGLCYIKFTTSQEKILEVGASTIPNDAKKDNILVSTPGYLGAVVPAFKGGKLSGLKIWKK